MSVLVLGGAGYIGSHTVDRLVEAGKDVVVVDSLVTGHLAAVRKEAKFYQGDLADKDFMRKVFTENSLCSIFISCRIYERSFEVL